MVDCVINLLATAHFFALGMLFLYGVHRLWLLSLWYRERKRVNCANGNLTISGDCYPFVTVQLPLYNERFVASRLIDACAGLAWPRDKLEIQVLDDSDDDTRGIVDERAKHWAELGLNVKVMRRARRSSYKAGALNYGLDHASGTYIAIFDADFVPPPDFIRKTISYFQDEHVGMVQARWDFLNAHQSWLTRVQSILLGAHFRIEHWVRFRRGLFFNFNGTAGIWRKEAIVSSGGWEDDTVTEDLDLSYRAQLAGWKFVYLDDLRVPSELPSTIASFRSQQQRWAKGSIQTARKILPRLLNTHLPLSVKIEACFHLLSNLGWLFGMIIILTLFPAILVITLAGPEQMIRIDFPLFIGGSCMILFYFLIHACYGQKRSFIPYVAALPFFSIAVAPSISLSVINGILRWGGPFERTPKFGIQGVQKVPRYAYEYLQSTVFHVCMNCMFLLYSLIPFFYALYRETWFALPLLALFPSGFLMVILKEMSEMHIRNQREM